MNGVLRRLLLCSVLAALGCDGGKAAVREELEISPSKVHVYYFHRTVRCPSCEKIEAWARQAVEQGFAEELAADRIAWSSVDIDEPPNRHFEDDFNLSMQSVVVSEERDGESVRWKDLGKVWDLLEDESEFSRYVRDEIRVFLDARTSSDP